MSTPITLPLIHDEPLARVLRVLQLELEDDGTYRGTSLPQTFNHIYGGQVLAQALLAAAATVEEDRQQLPNSLHSYFLRPGNIDKPLSFSVDRIHNGRSFSTRTVHARQEDREILTVLVSFQKKQPGLDHQIEMPEVEPPENLRSALEVFRAIENPVGKFLGKTTAFDLRHIGESLYVEASQEKREFQQVWMRPRNIIPAGTDQIVHRALLTYVVDQIMMEPAMRRHGVSWSTPGLIVASLDHAMWFHREVDINEWLLYHQTSPSATGARGLSSAAIFTREGKLVATVNQEALIHVADLAGSESERWKPTADKSASSS